MKTDKPTPCSTRLDIKATPGASRDELTGWLGAALKVRVVAPPERGRANAAIAALVADALAIPTARVRIVAGGGSRRKVAEIIGLSERDVHDRLRLAMSTRR